MIGRTVVLRDSWLVGEPIGQGSFGRVHEATSGATVAAIKFVPKAPGADRELLFVDIPDAVNVVPTIDSGEVDDYWVLVMPRAERSVRELLSEAGGILPAGEAVEVMADVASALAALVGRVVHRDLKPENVLLLGGRWCVADFGISRYSEASTASDTHKFRMTPEYASPEQWRSEHALSAADVYAFGVIAYELISGTRPFPGPQTEDFREQHLHQMPTPLSGVPAPLAAMIEECLLKAPGARPTPANIVARLDRLSSTPRSGGLAALEEANRLEVLRQAADYQARSQAQTRAEERQQLFEAAVQLHAGIAAEVRDAITFAAPAAVLAPGRGAGWSLRLGDARLTFTPAVRTADEPWRDEAPPAFTVIAHGEVALNVPADRSGYEGRSHSLWYCDAQQAGRFEWFETAFMVSPLISISSRQKPFSSAPSMEAARALGGGWADFQVAWPFTPVVPGEGAELVERWAGWFASASVGQLRQPNQMPERDTSGSWRRR